MIGIIGAMDIEVDGITAEMQINEVTEISATKFYVGTLYGKEVVVAKCGVGKVNAAVCTQSMIFRFSPELIINSGIAGGLAKDIKIGDLVIGTSCVQYDFDTTATGDPLATIFTNKGNFINMPCDKNYSDIIFNAAENVYEGKVFKGVIATGDKFVADPELSLSINEKFDALACEMESAAICQTCFLNDVSFVGIRSISDNAYDSDTVDFKTFSESSAERLIKLLNTILPNI